MQKYINVFAALLSIFVILINPGLVDARIGVGVGTGKIQVTQKLKPGQIYLLPSISVLNTGDEKAVYKVGIEYHEKQPENMPPRDWFLFEPNGFELEPGQAKLVEIRLNVPLKAIPGEYFAYLEASPDLKSVNGQTSVGVAAASKLYFTISPANFIEGVYYRTISLWKLYEPWTSRTAYGIGVVIALILFKKYFRIELNTTKKKEGSGNN